MSGKSALISFLIFMFGVSLVWYNSNWQTSLGVVFISIAFYMDKR